MSPATTTAELDATGGAGIYKLGYVTADVDRAIARMGDRYGIRFARFDPQADATDADGRTGPTSLRCAFSLGRELVIELMEPVSGALDLFTERVPRDGLAFHHVGVLVEDLETTIDTLPEPPLLTARMPTMAVTYSRLPLLDHYIEHVQYAEGGDAFLRSVRAPLPAAELS